MKPKWLKEIKELLPRADFQEWWRELSGGVDAYEEANERYNELLMQENLSLFRSDLAQKNAIDLLYRAGEQEDQAARLLAEAAELDNRSYEAVGKFENQRVLVSDIWYKLGAMDQTVEEYRERAAQIGKDLAEKKDRANRAALEGELKRLQAEQKRLQQEMRRLSETYERESARKGKLWEEVERMWNKSLEINLGVPEKERKGVRDKHRAQELFRLSEETKVRAEQLKKEAEAAKLQIEESARRVQELYGKARERFDCIVDEEFLYWAQRENSKRVYCVPLINDSASYNIEVKALTAYQVDRQRGVAFLEPLPLDLGYVEVEDRRTDEFFSGRTGLSSGTDPGPQAARKGDAMEKIEILQRSKLFDNLLQEELGMLADLCQRRDYPTGEIVFRQGDPGNSMYVIVEGTVDVVRQQEGGADKVLATLKAPDFFGEMSLIDKEVRSATIRTGTETVFLVLTTENLHSFAKVYRNGFTMLVINIARVMSGRLRETNKRLAQAL